MKYYLKDILRRLQKYSATLDQDSFLVDKPWVVSNNGDKFEKLIFKRDGSVILSINGDVTVGKWEYLPEAQALFVDYGNNKKLYRHQYLDDAVLALKIDGADKSDENYYLLANENIVQDHDAKRYLIDKSNSNSKQLPRKTELDAKIITSTYNLHRSGLYKSTNGNFLYEVNNNKIIQEYKLVRYPSFLIYQKIDIPTVGDVTENCPKSFILKIVERNLTYKIFTDEKGYITWIKDKLPFF